MVNRSLSVIKMPPWLPGTPTSIDHTVLARSPAAHWEIWADFPLTLFVGIYHLRPRISATSSSRRCSPSSRQPFLSTDYYTRPLLNMAPPGPTDQRYFPQANTQTQFDTCVLRRSQPHQYAAPHHHLRHKPWTETPWCLLIDSGLRPNQQLRAVLTNNSTFGRSLAPCPPRPARPATARAAGNSSSLCLHPAGDNAWSRGQRASWRRRRTRQPRRTHHFAFGMPYVVCTEKENPPQSVPRPD